jgi:HAD superfamily hydrolase (TIGR01509 family)
VSAIKYDVSRNSVQDFERNMNSASPAAAIIFDVDGTIVDTEPANAAASARVFREVCGVEVKAEDFQPFVGMGDRRYMEGVAEKYGVKIDLVRAVEMRERYILEIAEKEGLRAFPGMREIITAVRRRKDLLVAIATSGSREKSRSMLRAAGVDPDGFAAYVTGDEVAEKKPHPAIYLLTAKRLGIAPVRCVVIEDAPSGVAAAKRAGMRCVAVAQTVTAAALAGADRIVKNIDEIGLNEISRLAYGGANLG